MQVSIDHFRGFRHVEHARVAPLTILIGENSAGKTSFLAMIRLLYDMFRYSTTLSFNKEPFLLGAYEQVAHFRGGKGGRANRFGFKVSDKIFPSRRIVAGNEVKRVERSASLSAWFNNKYSQPALCEINFELDKSTLSVFFEPKPIIKLKTKSIERSFDLGRFFPTDDVFDTSSRSMIYSLIGDLPYMLRSTPKEIKEFSSIQRIEITELASYYLGLIDWFRKPVYASSPVRTKPDRAYTPLDVPPSPEGDHIPYLLAKLKRHQQNAWDSLHRKLDEFGRDSGLFDSINVKNLGRSESDPFQIYVKFGGPQRNIIDVGYGVSQVLPIATEIFSQEVSTVFLLQQPEVHLHPRAQAALGSLFCQSAVSMKHVFLLETHSDFILDRVRTAVRDGVLTPSDVSVLYFERERLENRIFSIDIDAGGNLIDVPSGFRKFFIEESLRSIG